MNHVEEFIIRQDGKQQRLLSRLRALILNAAPGIEEKISYKIPFFYYKGPLCYLNPKPSGIDLGFTKGYLLSNEQQVLEKKDRKQVRTILLEDIEHFPEAAIREILQEALLLNEFSNS